MGTQARFVVRATLTGVAAANASLVTLLVAGDPVSARAVAICVSLGLGSSLAYAGIGAVVPQVEPHVGNQLDE